MVVPERAKVVKSFRIPTLVYKSVAFMIVALLIVLGVILYDYAQIVRQVYKNKHLTLENRELREQIQIFQMKLNSLTNDINRIQIFEKKLKIMTGLSETEISEEHNKDLQPDLTLIPKNLKNELIEFKSREAIGQDPKFINYQELYDQRIASIFGLEGSYQYARDWTELIQRSFALSTEFSLFDYKYNKLKKNSQDLETQIHELDQFLLDNKSILNSTPSVLPARGWITSYYGPRNSPTSGRLKMHEGLDIGGPIGTPIIAPADGVITYSGNKAGFGKFVQIDHGYGLETIFGHANNLFVKEGQVIKRGHKIASLGNTGISTGPHLHYEVRVNGIAVDPLYYVLD